MIPQSRRVDDEARRRLRRPAGALRGDGRRWAGMHGPRRDGDRRRQRRSQDGRHAGAVFRVVPKAKQKAALAFLDENVFATPDWLQPKDIMSRIGPTTAGDAAGGVSSRRCSARAPGTPRRGRAAMMRRNAYPLAEYLGDLKRVVWGAPSARREPPPAAARVPRSGSAALVNPPPPPAPAPGAAGRRSAARRRARCHSSRRPTSRRAILPALARAQLREIQRDARASRDDGEDAGRARALERCRRSRDGNSGAEEEPVEGPRASERKSPTAHKVLSGSQLPSRDRP